MAITVGRTYSDVPRFFGTQSLSAPTTACIDASTSSGSSGGMHSISQDLFRRRACLSARNSRTWSSAPRNAFSPSNTAWA